MSIGKITPALAAWVKAGAKLHGNKNDLEGAYLFIKTSEFVASV